MKKSSAKNTKARRRLTPDNKIISKPDGAATKPTSEEDALRRDREAVMHDQFKAYQKTDES
jgi:hypothetical protein